MKTLRPLLTVMIILMTSFGSFNAMALNDSERVAQKSMMEYLRSKGYSPAIDNRDESVNFKKNDILYWITFQGNASGILYTLHRRPIKLNSSEKTPEQINQVCEVAEKAANLVNATEPYKVIVRGPKVEFEYPIYCQTAKEYQEIFPHIFKTLSASKDKFDAQFPKGRNITDSIHHYWLNLDTIHRVVPQKEIRGTKNARNLSISRIAVRNLSGADQVMSDYDQGLRKNKCQYLQEKIALIADNPGLYKVGVKIITPDGKILVPSSDATYTTITTINVSKAKKENEYELLKFGSDQGNLWEAGEYKIQFFEDEAMIFEDSFNIL